MIQRGNFFSENKREANSLLDYTSVHFVEPRNNNNKRPKSYAKTN